MTLLTLTFLFPLLGFVILAFSMGRLPQRWAALIGVGSVGLAALCAFWVGYDFLSRPPVDGVFRLPLWVWLGSTLTACWWPCSCNWMACR